MKNDSTYNILSLPHFPYFTLFIFFWRRRKLSPHYNWFTSIFVARAKGNTSQFFCRLVQLACSDLTPQSTETLDWIKLMAFFYYDIQTHGIKPEKCSIRIFACCNAGNRNLWMLRRITGFRLSEKPSWLTARESSQWGDFQLETHFTF